MDSLKRLWLKLLGEPPRYVSDYHALEQRYRSTRDPWSYGASWYETARLSHLEWLLQRVAPRGARLLEVGCSEGHFTSRLVRSGFDVTAIDVSITAIARAMNCAPAASFAHCCAEEFAAPGPFDIVLATEMLYYSERPEAVLAALERLGKVVVVSYTLGEANRLDPLFSTHNLEGSDTFRFPWNLPTPWGIRTHWWRPDRRRPQEPAPEHR